MFRVDDGYESLGARLIFTLLAWVSCEDEYNEVVKSTNNKRGSGGCHVW